MATAEEIEEFLAHFGVKGQQWGVRRDARALKTASRLRRVDEGTASVLDRQKTYWGVGRGGLGGVPGIKNAGKTAAGIENRVAARQARRESGEGLSSGQKKALAIGGATAATAVGVGAAALVLKSQGRLTIPSKLPPIPADSRASDSISKGRKAFAAIDQSVWKTQVKDFESQLADSNNELYKGMVRDAARAGIPTISRAEFDAIR